MAPPDTAFVSTSFPFDSAAEPLALCLGWDVGGWHGQKDGLGAVALSVDGVVHRVGHGMRASLGGTIAAGTLGIEDLLEMVGMLRERPWQRLLIGIDAPLGLPEAFVRITAARITDKAARLGQLSSTVIENRLAYRDTERAVCAEYRSRQKAGWHPLSPSFDGMGSNVSKARTAASQLRWIESDRLRVIPFEADIAPIAVLEVYPALWNALREDELDPSVTAIYESARSEDSPDVRDGILCALAAACYERTRLGMEARPQTMLPPPDPSIAVEGWIYAPQPVSNSDGAQP